MTGKPYLGALLALTVAFAAAPSRAQEYPNKPIHLVVPYSAGGGVDAAARVIAQQLSRRLGQTVVVENKPGGNGLIATQYVARALPDGYTLYLCSTNPYSMLPALYKRPLGYDPQKDYTPIALVAEFPAVFVVHPKRNIKSMSAFVDYAKANPGKLSYASSGSAQVFTLATELLKMKVGVDILHVPFQGGSPAIQAVMSGTVDSSLMDVGGFLPSIKAGRVVPLAVLGKRRVPSLPDVPTLEEAGMRDVEIPAVWTGIVGPAGVPPAIVNRLNKEINAEMRSKEVTSAFETWSLSPLTGTPDQLDARIKSDVVAWGGVINRLGLRLD